MSWHQEDALPAIENLCRTGESEVPIYDIARDGRVGARQVKLDGSAYFVAEGICAQEIVGAFRIRPTDGSPGGSACQATVSSSPPARRTTA